VARAAPALLLEAVLGYPAWVERRVSHPVAWIGRGLEVLEGGWNRPEWDAPVKRGLGVLAAAIVVGGAAMAAAPLERARRRGPLGQALALLAALPGPAQRSLFQHVDAVRQALAAGDLPAARKAVGRIVGRDTAALTAEEVAATAVESLAESFNDGVVAPAVWLALVGLPGLWAYKAANTADSMIGHMEPRWRDFGWAAARLDDLLNLLPARLAGALLCLAGGGGWRVMRRDAGKHASPNAGWPEAAMAGALGVGLGGPAAYDGVMVDRPRLGDGRRPAIEDLDRALTLYRRACGLLILLVGAAELAVGGRRR
jgi:adenosylcobinamide-phosphate synthase